jgi:transcriptional regulator with XRE-family HTH domain
MTGFSETLRDWRRQRRMSQLSLALEADVSARHIAFLETGRARPSRRMVMHLAEVLALPHGARNAMLGSAGYAPHYPEMPLDGAEMTALSGALARTIGRHDPYPGLVLDRLWRIVALNAAALRLLAPIGLGQGGSLLDALATPGAGAAAIENWGEVGHHTMLRLRSESRRAGGIPELDAAVRALAADPAVAAWAPPDRPRAVLPTVFRAGPVRLSLFSVFAEFGTAEEVRVSDMRIELMFPADAATRALLERAPGPGGAAG